MRSGVLTSVHAFANDPERGVYLLAITGVFMGGALLIFAARANAIQGVGVFGTVSRESALVLNNVLLAVAALVVFIGTVWPLVAELAFSRKVSVGPPFFDASFTPFFMALALILPIGTVMPWKRARIGRIVRAVWLAAVGAFGIATLIWMIGTERTLLGPAGAFLGSWVILGAVADFWARTGRERSGRLRRAIRLPRSDWGRFVAHAGLGITMIGISLLLAWEVEDIRIAKEGETFSAGRYELTLTSVKRVQGPNYHSTQAEFRVARNGRTVAVLHPERRVYPVAGVPTTEAAIDNGFFRDVYLVIGELQDGGGWAVRTYIKPFANWIWTGAVIMALGGAMSLSDRRFRVGAGARRRAMHVAAE